MAADNKSATLISLKDGNEFRVDFELDAFDQPRIIGIPEPIGRLEPHQEVIREQVLQKMSINLPITEEELSHLKTLNEEDEREENRKRERDKLFERRAAGLDTHEEYAEKLDRLLVEQFKEKSGGKKLLFEASDDGASKRRKLWEARDRGEISLDECLRRTAAIRVAEEHAAKPRWLHERQCEDPCECASCDLSSCRTQLDEAIASGQMSRAAADEMWQARLAMD